MGKTDTVTRQYVKENQVFADAFNYLIYGGQEIIQPGSLHRMDSVAAEVPYGSDGAQLPVQKIRDGLKYLTAMMDEHTAYVILGIENQDSVHYAMPVKNMIYDALTYAEQVRKAAVSHKRAKDYKDHSPGEYLSGFYKDDRLVPVITLVLFFSAEKWDGPMSLHEMLEVKDERILSLVENYRIHLIAPAYLNEDELAKFHSSLREVLSFIRCSTDKQQLIKLVKNNKRFTALDRNAAMVINACTNAEFKIDSKSEVVDVCKAIAEIRDEGHTEGFVEGRAEGALEANKETALRMLKEGSFSYGMISAMTSLPLEEVERLAGNSTDFSGEQAVQ